MCRDPQCLKKARKSRALERMLETGIPDEVYELSLIHIYKAPGSLGEKFDYRGIHVVYTKERETGDMYIERFLQQVGKNDHEMCIRDRPPSVPDPRRQCRCASAPPHMRRS